MKEVVLVGGGHAHLRVLAEAARRPWSGVRLTLVSEEARQHYSGMVPGYLQEAYREDEISFDLPRLCAAAGARFVEARIVAVCATDRSVDLGGSRLGFDLTSLDVGSAPAALDVPGAREHAWTVRPMSRAVALAHRAEELAAAGRDGRPLRIVVVGAGAGGVEVALALYRRAADAGAEPDVRIVDRGALLPGYSERVRKRVASILDRRGVRATPRAEVVAVEPDAVLLRGGRAVPADLVVWLTGAAAPPLLGRSELPTDPAGYFRVGPDLRSVDGAPVWGAGDCVRLDGHPDVPRAGVYAVRQAPVLARNLRAATDGGSPERYHPQATFLSLLDTADGRALLRWRGVVSHSRWAAWLKEAIDRRFVERYQRVYGGA